MISPNGIKSILFDLDGTLKHHIPSGGEMFTDYAISLGLSIQPEDRRRAAHWEHYYFANSPEIRADTKTYRGREIEGDGFWINFGRRRLAVMGCSPAQAAEFAPKISAYMNEAYKPRVWVPDEAPPLLAALQAAGFILGVVSNREKPFEEELESLGLRPYFHFSLAGGEVGSFKPEPGIFEEALRRAGTSAPETMYVGDNYFADAIGSHRAGLRAVLYDRTGLFPEAECPVIQSFDELPGLL